jgi:cysteine sulfinate desulfinase/cysteine desulfurase-like protein
MEPSRIIRSMGRTSKEAIGSVRISMGVGTTKESVDGLLDKLFDLVK